MEFKAGLSLLGFLGFKARGIPKFRILRLIGSQGPVGHSGTSNFFTLPLCSWAWGFPGPGGLQVKGITKAAGHRTEPESSHPLNNSLARVTSVSPHTSMFLSFRPPSGRKMGTFNSLTGPPSRKTRSWLGRNPTVCKAIDS